MKHLFHKQSILIFIAFCIFSSCKLTGDFAIVKRRHTNGYFVTIPSLVEYANNNTSHHKERIYSPQTSEATVHADNIDVIPSKNPIASTEIVKQEKALSQSNTNDEPHHMLKPIKDDIIYKGKPQDTGKTVRYIFQGHDKIFEWVSITGLIGNLLVPFFYTNFGFFLAMFIFSILALICSFIGFNRFENHPSYFKGKVFAIIGIIFGIFVVAIFCFIAIFGLYK